MSHTHHNAPDNLPTAESSREDFSVSHNHENSHHEKHVHEYNQHTEHKNNEEKSSNTGLRIAVIIGILIILFFIAKLIVTTVPKFISGFGTASVSLTSIFQKDFEVSLNKKEVRGGDIFALTTKNNTKNTGNLSFVYKCTQGIIFEYQTNGNSVPVVCDSYFPIDSNKSSHDFKVVGSVEKDTVIPVSVFVSDVSNNEILLDAGNQITIKRSSGFITPADQSNINTQNNSGNENNSSNNTNNNNQNNNSISTNTQNNNSNAETNSNSNNTTGNTNYNNYSNNSSQSDLAISLVSIGYEENERLISGNTIPDGAIVTLKFKVQNIGSASTGNWRISANLPTKIVSERNYTSPLQPSFRAGESYEFTMSFSQYDSQIKNIIITITGNDTNKANNVLTIPITSTGTINNNTGSKPDFEVTITEVGIMDKNTNQFYYTNNFNMDDKIAVKFQVKNIGGVNSPSWTYRVLMPRNGDDYYDSGTQMSLAPGGIATFTIGFDNPKNSNQTIKVIVDRNNNVSELNEDNNEASKSIYVNYYLN